MTQFPWFNLASANPLALLTLLAVLIPLVIHILSKTRGRLVKFAGIRLLQEPKQQPFTQLQFSQRRLLLLRIVFCILASLLLAQLFASPSSDNQPSRLNLITPAWLNHASDTQREALAEKLATEPAVLLTGNLVTLNQLQVRQWDSSQIDIGAQNLWVQIFAATKSLPDNTTLGVYTTASSRQFVGAKPTIAHTIDWQIIWPQLLGENMDLGIVIIAAPDSFYLPFWQRAISVLQASQLPTLRVEYLTNTSDISQDNTDWVVHLPTQPNDVNLKIGTDPVAQLNRHIFEPVFPLMLGDVLLSQQDGLIYSADNLLTQSQIETQHAASTDQIAISSPQFSHIKATVPLSQWLSILLVIVFCIERLFSEKRRQQTARKNDDADSNPLGAN
jgi:hypothetical protein